STLFVSSGVSHGEALTIMASGEPHRFVGSSLSAGVLPTLGVAPILGRPFSDAEDAEGAQATIILSYQLWQTEFGGDPSVIGRQIVGQMDFDRDSFTVIGVMPRDFHYPTADVLFWVTNRFNAAQLMSAEE